MPSVENAGEFTILYININILIDNAASHPKGGAGLARLIMRRSLNIQLKEVHELTDRGAARIGDIVTDGSIRNRSTVTRQQTGRLVQFEIVTEARRSLPAWLERCGGSA
jgi:hypothetical protein